MHPAAGLVALVLALSFAHVRAFPQYTDELPNGEAFGVDATVCE